MRKKVINSQLTSYKTYLSYRRRMLNLAENVFEFVNLPEFIDEGYVNKKLVENGSIAFFHDKTLGVVALPYDVLGKLDIYGRPITIMARSYNGRYFRKLERDEFVIMYDNTRCDSIYMDILQMAERISLCVRTEDINITQQRTPRIWQTTPEKKKTLEDMITEFDSLAENIVTYDIMALDELSSVSDPAPYVTDKIDLHIDKLKSEFFSLIGVSSLTEIKKERMIKDEMAVSQGGTIASRFSRYIPRKRAIEKINEKFKEFLEKPIEVRFYDGLPSTLKSDNESVGDEDVSISMDDVTN